ncbi:citryl-CoA lyase [Parasedimentitalea huanghaiensis]|uniref:citrate synthase (unknown stereospecificity) n=1 Tax=Parasedimentitalea huanghaiensis TaxID=2682100 RepID=A0A6L6WJC2_9RHOB|nr:citryl-CoA lyase [Zongyanglinia huanghaiensis]MVO17913.1 citryl-CoA lyase [Zongyanglinia huanghaiensis]
MSNLRSDVSDWWTTEIIDMVPGQIRFRGHPIQDLIGNVTFPQMIWLMTRGALPTDAQSKLLECALVAAVDHGPQAPSIATARMAVTCGLGLNGAMASAVNMLDDVHGGAGEQAVELYSWIDDAVQGGQDLAAATAEMIDLWQSKHTKFVPGFGHRFHKPEDPRAPRLLGLVDEAAKNGVVSGRFAEIGRSLQTTLNSRKGKAVPMNIDGATAVIYAELGFAGPLARGLFCLSRSVGVIAHAWEQMEQGGRNKGPTPPAYRWSYKGPNPI